MLRLHVELPLAVGAELALPAPAARHVQVRRLQPGDALVLFDGGGGEWAARVAAITRSGVDVHVESYSAVDRELPLQVTLAVGMPANERMDGLVEKATELGVATIQPLHCERSVLRLQGERALRKQVHWQAVAVAAAEQSGRTRVPEVALPQLLADWLAGGLGGGPGGGPGGGAPARRWLLSPRAPAGLPPAPAAGAVVLLSGPEGGLAPGEEALAAAAGFLPVGLGPRVLRADTAPLAALAWLALAS